MAIITISRELAALGDETAQDLSKCLGYCLIERHTLEKRIMSYGVEPSILKKYDERKPGFIASLSQERDDYLHFLKMAIFQEAVATADKGCVFIGRGAYAVLAGISGIVPVFLVSNMEIRIERVRSYFRCDEKKARSIIEQSDRDRAGFHKYFFESDWKEPGNYRVSLNTGRLHPSVCAKIIEQVRDSTVSPEEEAGLARKLNAAFLAQKVAHRILYEKGVRVHFLDVAPGDNGEVMLFGVTNSKVIIDRAVSAAQEVEGVKNVVQSIQVVEEYNIVH